MTFVFSTISIIHISYDLLPLADRVVKNPVRTMVYKGHSGVCNYFVTLAYFSYFHNFSKPL
jgi:hypothetical protein